MNDQILREFQQQIDLALEPLIAAPHRLKTMREELLSHLVETYNEELARTETEQSARDAVMRRFGDPVDVCNRLQASVPKFEHAVFSFLSGKETPMTRALWIIAIAALVVRLFIFNPLISEQLFFAAIALITILCSRHLLQNENVASRRLGSRWPWLVGLFAFFFGFGVILPALARIEKTLLTHPTNPLQSWIMIISAEAITVGLLITLLGLFFLARASFRRRIQTS